MIVIILKWFENIFHSYNKNNPYTTKSDDYTQFVYEHMANYAHRGINFQKKKKGFEEGVDRKVLKFKHRNKHMKGLTRRKLNTRKKIRIF